MKLHNYIFNRKLLHTRLQTFNISDIPDVEAKMEILKKWKYSIGNSDLDKTKEESVQGDFLTHFFTEILGYKKRYGNTVWNITQEQKTKTDGTKADGALGFFTSTINDVRVVIELKDAKTDLDKKQNRANKLSAIEQAFSYASKSGKRCSWVIVSNFKEIRLYHSSDQSEYEKFTITDLVEEEEFKKFYFLLNFGNLINRDEDSLIQSLYNKSEEEQKSISKLFYKDYKQSRIALFEHLKSNNPDMNELVLFEKSQKLMDRFIFICFCEDTGLLPESVFRKVIEAAKQTFDISETRIWNQLKGLFHSIDKGNSPLNINKFNGGLFADDSVLDNLIIKDEIFRQLEKISEYDFDSDLNVNILGHIFEQSISDIEEIKAEIKGEIIEKKAGKRKKDGIFYTPEYVTKYIVEQSIGRWLEDRRRELGEQELPEIPEYNKNAKPAEKAVRTKAIKRHLEFWESYRDKLANIKVLDPACGSGAFLNQAFDFLYQEGQKLNEVISELEGGQVTLFDLDKHILKNNLFGVDLNKESVEITKLSLWLKTANKNNTLTTLDDNIKCGNSLINDLSLVSKDAFNWNKEFKDVLNEGGFDVIIGNPPYVRQELISKFKDYLKVNYNVYNSGTDLFAYFYEKSIKLLKKDGILGFISNNFSKTSSSKELRDYLQNKTSFINYTDFLDLQIFEGATTYPVILILRNNIAKESFCYYRVNSEDLVNLSAAKKEKGFEVVQETLEGENWVFISTQETDLRNKIYSYPSLKIVLGKSYRGIITGLNEAFIVDTRTREKFISDNAEAENLIVPYLEGKDLIKWTTKNADKWLLIFPKGWTREKLGKDVTEEEAWKYISSNFVEIAKYLKQYEERARKRYDKGEFWWELRACDYLDLFKKDKVFWPNLQSSPKFSFDTYGYYLNAPAVMIPTDKKVLLAILNSTLIWYVLKDLCVIRNGGYIEVKPQYIEKLPISLPKNSLGIEELVDEVINIKNNFNILAEQFLIFLKSNYNLKKISKKLNDYYLLTYEEFINELKKQKVKLSETVKFELMILFNEQKEKLTILEKREKEISNKLNLLVYELYKLNENDIDVLERLIR
ncbi:Eco57I restriction-modification methylase domain-containing protein [Priestia sp. YIM B13486]|uniref:Eco57I restriction-modification methylase domain-containing protein n=1 Tax=Priestia sp. YIM B13486 TaxID=3366304 RepID=UPI00366D137D